MTAQVAVGNRNRTITSADDSTFLILVTPSRQPTTEPWTGTWVLEFDPSFDFVGQIAVVGRAPGRAPTVNPPAFVPLWFTADVLNGTPGDNVTPQQAVISGSSLITVPAYGKQVALLVTCSAGSMSLYTNGPQAS